jgi:hypothetical protein
MPFSVHNGDVRIDLTSDHGPKKSWYFTSEQVRQVEGKFFLRIREGSHKVKRLLTSKIEATAKQNAYDTSLSRIDVIQQLQDVVRKEYKEIVPYIKEKELGGGGDVGATRYRSDLKSSKKKKLTMPDVMSITTPKVEHVEGITMNVLPDLRKLYIEIVPENISYLTDAICAQSAAGGVAKPPYKRQPPYKRRRTDNGSVVVKDNGNQDGVNEDNNREDGRDSNDTNGNDSRESADDNDIVDDDVCEDVAGKDGDNIMNENREIGSSPESTVERPKDTTIKSGNMRQSSLLDLFNNAA